MDKLLSMLGLSARAGKIASGRDAVEIALQKKVAKLIVIDASASESTKKAVYEMAERSGVTAIEIQRDSLGQAIGKPGRILAAVTDQSFADRIHQLSLMKS
ncbi:MAG: ribosomal L7Ae/L30e/S12e/Gadd45 family protein [Clostridia bacterium]|nr:ribosomal L7Ae/L30e/S12e/Gadd45 family protein [Clostridia bacterium]